MDADRACLVVFSGPPGVGKSTLAYALARYTGWAVLARDQIDRTLESSGGTRPRTLAYTVMRDLAALNLRLGASLILDAVYPQVGFRAELAALATRHGARFRPIVCACADEAIWRGRVESRTAMVPGWTPADWTEARRVAAAYQPWLGPHLALDAAEPPDQHLCRMLDYLDAWRTDHSSLAIRMAPLTEPEARAIADWRYPPPYDFYDGDADPDDPRELLDRASPYYAAHDAHGDLIGFFCFRETAQVPGGHAVGAYDDAGALDIGLGMRPDLTGRGLGLPFTLAGLRFARAAFAPATFRLSVAGFNARAIRVYERAGFQITHRFLSATNGGEHEFVAMTRQATQSSVQHRDTETITEIESTFHS